MALHNSGIGVWRHDNSPWRAGCHVSIRQSPSLCNAILNTCPCLLAIKCVKGFIKKWINENMGDGNGSPVFHRRRACLGLDFEPQRNIEPILSQYSYIYIWFMAGANLTLRFSLWYYGIFDYIYYGITESLIISNENSLFAPKTCLGLFY